jgi:type IV pilus assembly protein PilA
MKRKGFTLVELLAVIAVLGLLIAIISPVVKKLINDSEDSLSKQQIEMIVGAAKRYMVDHGELLPEGSNKFAVYIKDLINDGVIDNDEVIDPKTRKEINGCVLVNYNENFNQYEYNFREKCFVKVSFDPAGGSISERSRDYLIGSTYDNLPIPTREGYTFIGWNGRNLLNLEVLESQPSSIENANTTQRIFDVNSYVVGLAYNNYFKADWVSSLTITKDTLNFVTKFGYGVAFPFLSSPGKSYVLSYDSTLNGGNSSSIPITSLLFYDVSGNLISYERLDGDGHKENKCIAPDNTNYLIVVFAGNGNGTNLTFSNIQLEEGNIATEYESYYITSDVKVTQESDHTLKAIWMANS